MPVKRAAPSWTGLSTAPHGWMTQTLSAGATGCAAGRASCACSRSAPSMCWVKGSTRCKGSYAGPSSSRAHRARSFATSSTSFREVARSRSWPSPSSRRKRSSRSPKRVSARFGEGRATRGPLPCSISSRSPRSVTSVARASALTPSKRPTMSEPWIRQTLTAEFLSDAHLGSGSGSGGIDALVARDRHDRPVIWASHVEGVLRDAARRLRGDEEAGNFFGRAGGAQQRAVFTSLYAKNNPESHIWRSTAREAFDNRAPKDDTLRAIEYVPKGTRLAGEVELPKSQLHTLKRLVQEVDALGGGRSTGAGRVKLTLSEVSRTSRTVGAPTGRLVLLLKNRDPLCITATATPDNLIPSLAFVPGRALLTSGKLSVSDALPLPHAPAQLDGVEVLPAPLTLQSEKPKGAAGDLPWWVQPMAPTKRLDAWAATEKLKRPEDDLFVYRENASSAWT